MSDYGNARKLNRTKTGDIFKDNLYNKTNASDPSDIKKMT